MTTIKSLLEKDAFTGVSGAHRIEGADEALIGFDYHKEVWVYDQSKIDEIIDEIGPLGMFGESNGRVPVFVTLLNKKLCQCNQ
jgi:hypothetical protein